MVFNVQLNSSQSESMGCSNALTLFTNINKFSIDFCRQSICVVIQKLQKSNSIPLSNMCEATTKIRFCLKLIPSAISYGGLLWHSNGIVIALVFKISMFSARVATCCRSNKDSKSHKQLVSQVKYFVAVVYTKK